MGLGLASSQVFSDADVEVLRWKHFYCQYFNDGATANLTGKGTALTNTGAQSGVTQTTSILNGSKYTTGSVSGDSSGVLLDAVHSRAHYIRISTQVSVVTTATVRISCSMANTTVANMVGSATPAFSYFGFRYDTGASDTTWKCVADNASGSPTIVNSLVSVSASEYLLQMLIDPVLNVVNYFVNNNFVGKISTTLPATSVVTLAPLAGLATLAASAANMNVHLINGRSRVGNI